MVVFILPRLLLILPFGAVFLMLATVSGCSVKKPLPPEPALETVSKCEAIFVLAPSHFMRYMDPESYPLLASEGREQDLAVYCTVQEARNYQQTLTEAKQLPENFWSVYRLDGLWETDVVEPEPGEFRMRHPARLYTNPEDNT